MTRVTERDKPRLNFLLKRAEISGCDARLFFASRLILHRKALDRSMTAGHSLARTNGKSRFLKEKLEKRTEEELAGIRIQERHECDVKD